MKYFIIQAGLCTKHWHTVVCKITECYKVFLGLDDITLDEKERISQISSYFNFLQGLDSNLTRAPAEVSANP